MTGTIYLSPDVMFDLRTIDFRWIAEELLARKTAANEDVLLAVFDAIHINMLCADELDAHDFRLFALTFDDLVSTLPADEVALIAFLEQVRAAIKEDPRVHQV